MLSDADKAARRSGLGGSDVADLADGKAFRVYASKVDGVEREIDPLLARRGNVLEAPTLELYRLETGAELLPGGFVRHPSKPFLLGNLDARALRDGGEVVVEAKTAGRFALADWGEPGTDQIPQRYIIQVQHYLGLTGLEVADVAALLGGDLAVYRVEFDPELFGMLAEMAEKFWRDHVEAKRPPPPDATDECSAWLAQRFSTVRGELKPAPPEASPLVEEYRTASVLADAAQARRDAAKNALKALIGEAPGMVGEGWRIGWNPTKGRESTDWKAVAAEAGVSPEVIKRHTTRKSAYRAFRLNGGSDNE